MSNDEQARSTRQLVHKILDCSHAWGCEGSITKWADAYEIVEQYTTTLLASHVAKIKELEDDLEECGRLLIDSNELLQARIEAAAKSFKEATYCGVTKIMTGEEIAKIVLEASDKVTRATLPKLSSEATNLVCDFQLLIGVLAAEKGVANPLRQADENADYTLSELSEAITKLGDEFIISSKEYERIASTGKFYSMFESAPPKAEGASAEDVLRDVANIFNAAPTVAPWQDALSLIKQRDVAREAKLVEALRFYADKQAYKDQDNSCSDPNCCTPVEYIPVIEDAGELARETLEELGYG